MRSRGFTLVELLTALLLLALLALMAHRGLGAVLDARRHVGEETEKWRRIALFFARFESDVRLAAPRGVRTDAGTAPAWVGAATDNPGVPGSRLEFTRFASPDGADAARRLAYRLNAMQEIELWSWPGLDLAANVEPVRHTVLPGVARMELHYLDSRLVWHATWPVAGELHPLPRAVLLNVVLASGEALTRIFSLRS